MLLISNKNHAWTFFASYPIPIVERISMLKRLYIKQLMRFDFPTPESPIRATKINILMDISQLK